MNTFVIIGIYHNVHYETDCVRVMFGVVREEL